MNDPGFWSSLFSAHHLIEAGGLLVLVSLIYLETAFFVGLILPGGDYMLFAAGIFCGTQYLELSLPLLILILAVTAFAGDLTGYTKGKWLGEKFFTDNKSRFFKPEYLEKGNRFFTRYGIWAFIIGRFMPVIRTLVPMIAGASAYAFRKFLVFDIVGAIIWTGTLVPLGYFVGKTYPEVISYSGYIILLFVLIASFPALRIILSKRK